MADYIDREELLKYAVGFENGTQWVSTDVINEQPVIEQKHGHWEVSAYCNHKPYRLRHVDKWTIWRCSVCGKNNGRCHSDAYCRHCGSKMDEVTE